MSTGMTRITKRTGMTRNNRMTGITMMVGINEMNGMTGMARYEQDDRENWNSGVTADDCK